MVYVVIPQPPNHCSNFLRIITYGRMENEIYTAMQYLYVYHNYNPIGCVEILLMEDILNQLIWQIW